jgi:hypothetical protein
MHRARELAQTYRKLGRVPDCVIELQKGGGSVAVSQGWSFGTYAISETGEIFFSGPGLTERRAFIARYRYGRKTPQNASEALHHGPIVLHIQIERSLAEVGEH